MNIQRGDKVYYFNGFEDVSAIVTDIRIKEDEVELEIDSTDVWISQQVVDRVESYPKAA